uniref:Uncharacterized protein n=1 Tax=Rhizophora mucronata TaxID=61149 RepID=A0A2P2PJ77_RHIMU
MQPILRIAITSGVCGQKNRCFMSGSSRRADGPPLTLAYALNQIEDHPRPKLISDQGINDCSIVALDSYKNNGSNHFVILHFPLICPIRSLSFNPMF